MDAQDSPSPTQPAATPTQPVPPPRIVMFIAAAAVVFGAMALVGSIYELSQGGLWFNLGILGIPFGRRLLAGREGARKVGVWLQFLAIGVAVVSGARAALGKDGTWVSGESTWFVRMVISLVMVALIVGLRGLRSEPTRRWFALPAGGRANCAGWVWPLVFVGMFVGIGNIDKARESEAAVARLKSGLFMANTTFRFVDAKTGKPVAGVSARIFSFSMLPGVGRPLDAGLVMSSNVVDGFWETRFKGMAFDSQPLIFGAPEYENSDYVITKSTPEQVTIEMKPVGGK